MMMLNKSQQVILSRSGVREAEESLPMMPLSSSCWPQFLPPESHSKHWCLHSDDDVAVVAVVVVVSY